MPWDQENEFPLMKRLLSLSDAIHFQWWRLCFIIIWPHAILYCALFLFDTTASATPFILWFVVVAFKIPHHITYHIYIFILFHFSLSLSFSFSFSFFFSLFRFLSFPISFKKSQQSYGSYAEVLANGNQTQIFYGKWAVKQTHLNDIACINGNINLEMLSTSFLPFSYRIARCENCLTTQTSLFGTHLSQMHINRTRNTGSLFGRFWLFWSHLQK